MLLQMLTYEFCEIFKKTFLQNTFVRLLLLSLFIGSYLYVLEIEENDFQSTYPLIDSNKEAHYYMTNYPAQLLFRIPSRQLDVELLLVTFAC